MARNVPRPLQDELIVRALQVREALGAERPHGPRGATARGGSGARRRHRGRNVDTKASRRTGSAEAESSRGREAHGDSMVPGCKRRPSPIGPSDESLSRSQLSTRSKATPRPGLAVARTRRPEGAGSRLAGGLQRPQRGALSELDGRRRRTRQRAPANAWLATVANPYLVLAQREQEVGDAVGGGQRGVRTTRTHQQCTRRPHARAARPPFPTSQTPKGAALHHQARARVQLTRLVAHEVAEQARGP